MPEYKEKESNGDKIVHWIVKDLDVQGYLKKNPKAEYHHNCRNDSFIHIDFPFGSVCF